MMWTINEMKNPRIWELQAGDAFRGRTITDLQGVAGIAHNSVALLYFCDYQSQAIRLPAAYVEDMHHADEVVSRARRWVRDRRLCEG